TVYAAGIAAGIDKGHVLVGLEDAPGRTLARNTQRLARHDGVILVRPHVELLHFVPELRLVDRTAQVAEPRGRVELEIISLIDCPAAAGGLRRTASASTAGHVIPDPVGI